MITMIYADMIITGIMAFGTSFVIYQYKSYGKKSVQAYLTLSQFVKIRDQIFRTCGHLSALRGLCFVPHMSLDSYMIIDQL